ncbi:hypothetical protein [Clavibacter tessellarius]|uniref:hypothetical protein n=1 Tax=Clavibacter tessellarius TaxID=31965 RepID=UPI0032468BE8
MTFPSGSRSCRWYMKPRSTGGLASDPPAARPAVARASTSARLSSMTAVMAAALVDGSPTGRSRNDWKKSRVSSMKALRSASTTRHAAFSSVKSGFTVQPTAS